MTADQSRRGSSSPGPRRGSERACQRELRGARVTVPIRRVSVLLMVFQRASNTSESAVMKYNSTPVKARGRIVKERDHEHV